MQFKLLILTLLPSTLALPEPAANLAAMEAIKAQPYEGPGEVSARHEPGSLVARACTHDGCTSQSGASAGKYCGFCTQVRTKWNVNDIYQYEPHHYVLIIQLLPHHLSQAIRERLTEIFRVNGGSGTSSCCNYGYSTACAAHWPAVSPK
jgi:hypothetical protein